MRRQADGSARDNDRRLAIPPPALSQEPHAVELFAETWQEKVTLALGIVALVLILQMMGIPL
jgi:hypothetical protein